MNNGSPPALPGRELGTGTHEGREPNSAVFWFRCEIFFFLDATRNTDRFEDKAVVQDRIELLRGIAHLTMVNTIIGGGGSCDFRTDRVGLMSILLTPYSYSSLSYSVKAHCW